MIYPHPPSAILPKKKKIKNRELCNNSKRIKAVNKCCETLHQMFARIMATPLCNTLERAENTYLY